MNRTEATRILARLIGKGFAWREDPRALVGDEREAAWTTYTAARAALEVAKAALYARERAALAADAEYQARRAEYKAATLAVTQASSGAHRDRITVGANLGWAFSVDATGDNWQEVVDKVRALKKSK